MMRIKSIYFLLLLTLNPYLYLNASCSDKLMVWPTSKKINVNSVIILFGKTVPQGKLYLKSKADRIELGVLIWCYSSNGVSQILLSPKQKLKPGTVYALVNDSGRVLTGIKEGEGVATISWKTSGTIDELAPKMETFPHLKQTILPDKSKQAVCYRFSYKAKESSPSFVLVFCKEVGTNTTQIQLVPTYNNSFDLCMVNCRGRFNFEKGKNYFITFQLTDSSGNVADLAERPVRLSGPEN